MRWSALAVLGLLLLAGCSSPKNGGSPSAPSASGPPAPGADAAAANATALQPLRFAGDTREQTLPVAETFQATQGCTFGLTCPDSSYHDIDLSPIIQPNVPVELSLKLTSDSGYNAYIFAKSGDATFVRYESHYNQGVVTIDTLLVRASAGAVTLEILYFQPDLANPQASNTVEGAVHTVTRVEVVPPYVPVALALKPGDRINATGDGLDQLALLTPQGKVLRDLTFPYNLTVPADAPAGTYIAFAQAEAAAVLYGPAGTTLSARLLEFTSTTPVDLAPNADTAWDMAVDAQPIVAGVQLLSKATAPTCCTAVAPVVGSHKITLNSPDNVDVLGDASATCGPTPWCGFGVLGQMGWGYGSSLLDEHLVPGTYHATVHMDVSNNMQGYSWAVFVHAAA